MSSGRSSANGRRAVAGVPLDFRAGQACARPPGRQKANDAIEKTVPFRFDVGEDGAGVDELVGRLRWLGSMGIETVFGYVVGAERITPLEVMGRQVIATVAGMDAS